MSFNGTSGNDLSADDLQVGAVSANLRLMAHVHNEKTRKFIEDNSIPIPFAGCWIWNKSTTARGEYGQVGYNTYGTEKAHRLSFVAFKGTCQGKFVLHACDTPLCVNPNHLFLGTALDNHLDMVKKGRGNYAKAAKKMRKLTPEQVREIRQSKLTQLQLAKIYNVSGSSIGQARRYQQYKDVI